MATQRNAKNPGSVPRALRFQILRRDNHSCRYCGQSAPDVKLTVDHVVPVALGGTNEPTNLVTACAACNGGKSATPPDAAIVDDVSMRALRWAKAMEAAARMRHAELATRDQIREDFKHLWERWTYTDSGGERPVELPTCWPVTVDQLTAAGLGVVDFGDAIDITMRTDGVKDRFKYFCGVAWRMVNSIQELAAELADSDEAEPSTAEAEPPVASQDNPVAAPAYPPSRHRPFVDKELAWKVSAALGITYAHDYPGAAEIITAVEREVIKFECPYCKAEPGACCHFEGRPLGTSHLQRYHATIAKARMYPPGYLLRVDASEAIPELYAGGLS